MRGIYRLTCDDPDLIYYGSSNNIYKRFSQHKTDFNNKLNSCSSYKLFEVGSVEIELVLDCSGTSREEMREIEQTYIENDICINKANASGINKSKKGICGIYRLTCDDPDLVYYGSSNDIYKRFYNHKYKLSCSSSKLFEVGGVEIEVVLDCSGTSREEMLEIEQTYIENDICVNKSNASGINKSKIINNKKEYLKSEEYKEYLKKYRQTDNYKQYRERSKLEYRQCEKYKESMKQYNKAYYLKKKQMKEI